jgi:hypothetical protein
MDVEAMESGKGQVGQGKRKMGRLPEAVEGSEPDRSKELVVPRVLHDQLSNCCFHSGRAVPPESLGAADRLSIIGSLRLPARPDLDRWRRGLLAGGPWSWADNKTAPAALPAAGPRGGRGLAGKKLRSGERGTGEN